MASVLDDAAYFSSRPPHHQKSRAVCSALIRHCVYSCQLRRSFSTILGLQALVNTNHRPRCTTADIFTPWSKERVFWLANRGRDVCQLVFASCRKAPPALTAGPTTPSDGPGRHSLSPYFSREISFPPPVLRRPVLSCSIIHQPHFSLSSRACTRISETHIRQLFSTPVQHRRGPFSCHGRSVLGRAVTRVQPVHLGLTHEPPRL